MKKWWLVGLLGFVAVASLSNSAPALATGPQGITITPTQIDLVVDPGQLYTGTFQILNQGKTGYDYSIFPAPYRVDDEDYTPDFTLLPGTTRVNDWFQFTILHGRAEPNQVVDVGYHIVVPRGATPGGYYAVAFAQTQYPQTTSHIVLNERVGLIFYLQVSGPIDQKSRVASWKADWLQRPPLIATLRLENDGAAHYLAKFKLNVKDVFGHTKYTFGGNRFVLPHTIRRFKLSWAKAPPLALFKVDGTVEALGQTTKLPTRYVLIMSDSVRRIFLILIIALTLIAAWRFLWYKRRRRAKK